MQRNIKKWLNHSVMCLPQLQYWSLKGTKRLLTWSRRVEGWFATTATSSVGGVQWSISYGLVMVRRLCVIIFMNQDITPFWSVEKHRRLDIAGTTPPP